MALTKEFLYDRLPGYPSCHGSTIAQRLNGEFIAAWFGGPHENHPETVVLFGRKRPQDDEWRDIRAIAGMTVRPYGNAALFVEPERTRTKRSSGVFIRSEGRLAAAGVGLHDLLLPVNRRRMDLVTPRLLKDRGASL